jgi:hypothetical protein
LTFKKLQHHQPQRDILLVSTKRKLTCLHKLLRLVKELQIKQLLHLKQGLSSQSVRDVVSLTESIRKRCQKWRLQCCTDWLQIPCDLLISTIDDLISTYHKNAYGFVRGNTNSGKASMCINMERPLLLA